MMIVERKIPTRRAEVVSSRPGVRRRVPCAPFEIRHSKSALIAFTLIEVLVAAAVASLLILVLLTITQNSMESYRQSVEGAAMERDANLVLDFLATDLETLATPRIPRAEALRCSVETVTDGNFCRLSMLASVTDGDPSNHRGRPRAISYRVAFQDPVAEAGGNRMYALYRTVATASVTFEFAHGTMNLEADFWNERQTTALGSYLAGNVADFKVRVQEKPDGQWRTVDSPGDLLRITADENNSQAIEVTLTLLPPRASKLVADGTLTRADAARQFGRSFTRQVSFRTP